MIPVEIRMALWDLMEVCDKADNLTNEEEEAVSDIFMACTRLSDFIIAQNRAQQEI